MTMFDKDSKFVNRGFHIDCARVRLMAYRLLAIFFAEDRFAALRTGDYESEPDRLCGEFMEVEIEHLLIEIAIFIRMIDDMAQRGRLHYQRYNPIVGSVERQPGSDKSDLTLRDACNKIIHSAERHYKSTEAEYSWNKKLEPLVELKGMHRKAEWVVVIDIEKFCFATCWISE